MLYVQVAMQPLSAQDKGVLSEEVRQAIRQELAAADFPPVRSSPGSPTVHESFAAFRGWLHRVLVAPMKARSADKPWAAEAAAFADAAMEALYCQRFVTDGAAALAGRARKLLTAGADDPVVLWLVVDILSKEKDDVSEARAQGAKAREAFLRGDTSKVLGMLLSLQQARLIRTGSALERDGAALKAAEYLAASLKEPGTWTAVEAPIYITTLRSIFPGGLRRSNKDLFQPLFHPDRFPEWARETLTGSWEVDLAWDGRGNDWAPKVTKEGWIQFGEHLTKAEKHLTKAWKLEPSQPFAATGMIAVAMAGYSSDSGRDWFDRATAARLDYMPAWHAMSWASRPRWGGRKETMRALALAALETGRFDTDIPFFLVAGLDGLRQELRGSEACRDLYRQPAVAVALQAMCQGYAGAVPGELSHWAWWRALGGWLSGRLEDTCTALTETGTRPIPGEVRSRLADLMSDEILLRGEAALDKAGHTAAWQTAVEAHGKMDFPAELGVLDKLMDIPAEAKPLIDRQRRLIGMETNLAAGEWVKLSADPSLSDWLRLDGAWVGQADGNALITGDGDRALMVHLARIGPAFEARGTIQSTHPENPRFCAGIAFGHHSLDSKPGQWVTAEIVWSKQGKSAMINRSYYNTGILDKATVADFSKPVPWTLKLQDDRLTWTLGGGFICENEFLGRDGNLKGHYTTTSDGRVGFCTRVTPMGSSMIYSPIEIRRLK